MQPIGCRGDALTDKHVKSLGSSNADLRPAAYADGRGLPVSLRTIDSRTSPRTWDGRLASLASNLGSPPVLASVAVALIALKLSSARAWMWGSVYLLLGVMMPFLYVVWLVKRGNVTDIDVRLRKQRFQPLLVTITCTGLAWLVLALGVAPATMTVVVGALWFQAVAVFAITLRWKISVHAATAAGATTMAWVLLGTPLPLVLIVPLVAWSRVRLRRHTLPQTVAGAVLGFVIFSAAATLMPSG